MTKERKKKQPSGIPPTRSMPDQIPDTPENVAKALMGTPPVRSWDYEKREEEEQEPQPEPSPETTDGDPPPANNRASQFFAE